MADLKTLPPGFLFRPTEEEIVCYYLRNKNSSFPNSSSYRSLLISDAIREIDVFKYDPVDLPELSGYAGRREGQWFFFTFLEGKMGRRNRGTESGLWKMEGRDRPVICKKKGVVGMKRKLVFYRGRFPVSEAERTEWMMEEYVMMNGQQEELIGDEKDSYALCRVFHSKSHVDNRRMEHSVQSFVEDGYAGPSGYQRNGAAGLNADIGSFIGEVNSEEVPEEDELQKILMEMFDDVDESARGLDAGLHQPSADVTTNDYVPTVTVAEAELLDSILGGDYIELNDFASPLLEPSSPG